MEEAFPNLKYLDVSNNKFGEFAAFKCPNLEYLDVSFNKLEKVNEGWAGHPKLKILKSIDNKFKNLSIFKGMPKLEELYLQRNNIGTIEGYAGLDGLKKLNLRKNKIDKIAEELPPLSALEYLNVRSNGV